MTLVELLVLALAAFRISRLIIEDTISEPLRDWLLTTWPGNDVEYDQEDRHRVRGGTIELAGKIYAQTPTKAGDRLAKLLGCYACTGFWVSSAWVAGFMLWPTVVFWVALPFALSGIVWVLALIQERID